MEAEFLSEYLGGISSTPRRKARRMKEEKDPFGSEPALMDGGEMFAQFMALNNQGAGALMPSMPAQLQGYM